MDRRAFGSSGWSARRRRRPCYVSTTYPFLSVVAPASSLPMAWRMGPSACVGIDLWTVEKLRWRCFPLWCAGLSGPSFRGLRVRLDGRLQKDASSRSGAAATTACHQLTLVKEIIAVWSKDLFVIFITCGVLCTTLKFSI